LEFGRRGLGVQFGGRHSGLVFSLSLAWTMPAFAGALAPCVKAVDSPNGNFLVITHADLEHMQGDASRARQVTLEVFPKEAFINAKDRVTAPVTYWSDAPQWSVILDSSNSHPVPPCPIVLVTNDGEFLIILNLYAADSALRIYRRRDHLGNKLREGPDHGVFIKDVALKDILPPDKLRGVQVMTDASPQWFAGGTFDFSADSRTLIHKTRWGNTARINLEDGTVLNNNAPPGLKPWDPEVPSRP
jgi:hypothetical protein